MATATHTQCFCEGFAINPIFKVRVKGSDSVRWVDYVGRDRIRYGWGTVPVYIFQFETADGRAHYGKQTFLAPELELIEG